MVKTSTGDRTDHRACEAGPRHAALLAKRTNWRRVTCSVVRGGLQPALVVARHSPSGAWPRIVCAYVAALPARCFAANVAVAPHNCLSSESTTATDRPPATVCEEN